MTLLDSFSLSHTLRAMQLLPNGIGGALMSTDVLHKQVRRDFVEKLKFPVW